jgi:hypothetical protein
MPQSSRHLANTHGPIWTQDDADDDDQGDEQLDPPTIGPCENGATRFGGSRSARHAPKRRFDASISSPTSVVSARQPAFVATSKTAGHPKRHRPPTLESRNRRAKESKIHLRNSITTSPFAIPGFLNKGLDLRLRSFVAPRSQSLIGSLRRRYN